jgi:hypothetical protein
LYVVPLAGVMAANTVDVGRVGPCVGGVADESPPAPQDSPKLCRAPRGPPVG